MLWAKVFSNLSLKQLHLHSYIDVDVVDMSLLPPTLTRLSLKSVQLNRTVKGNLPRLKTFMLDSRNISADLVDNSGPFDEESEKSCFEIGF